MAQSVERRLGKAEVTGPIPVSSSLKKELMFNISSFFYSKALLRECTTEGTGVSFFVLYAEVNIRSVTVSGSDYHGSFRVFSEGHCPLT